MGPKPEVGTDDVHVRFSIICIPTANIGCSAAVAGRITLHSHFADTHYFEGPGKKPSAEDYVAGATYTSPADPPLHRMPIPHIHGLVVLELHM
jgi:hypothetical protein